MKPLLFLLCRLVFIYGIRWIFPQQFGSGLRSAAGWSLLFASAYWSSLDGCPEGPRRFG